MVERVASEIEEALSACEWVTGQLLLEQTLE